MKTTRRIFALLMVVCLLAGYAVVPAYAASAASISFGDAGSRTSFSAEQQVWAADGLTVTINKADATTDMYDNIAKNYGEVRIYNGATVTIEYPGMTEMVFYVDDYKDNYLPLFVESIASADCGTVTNDGNVVTLELDEASDSVTYIARGASQHRLEKIEVYAGTAEEKPDAVMGTVTVNDLNVRDEASVTGKVVKQLPINTRVEILEQKTIDGVEWGRIESGWISMSYVQLDGADVEEPTEPEVTATVEAIADGSYVISTGAYTLAALAEDKTYGYPAAGDASAPAETDVVTITNVDGGFTMQDSYGRYLYMKGTYDSFNVGAEAPSEGHVWQLMNNGTNLYIVNVLKEKTLAYSTQYSSWGAYADSKLTDAHLTALTVTAYVEEEPIPGESAESPIQLAPGMFTFEDETYGTFETEVPANSTYYYVLYNAGGKEMTINGENAVMIEGGGMMSPPYAFTITNDTAEAATYVIALAVPQGARENPVFIYMLNAIAEVPAGSSQGYFLSYNAWNPGTLVLAPTCDDETIEFNVVLTNMSNYQSAYLSDSNDGTVSIDMNAGDMIMIELQVYPDSSWNYPAANIALNGEVLAPVGSWENPDFITESTTVELAEDSQGYYYHYIAEESGALKVTVSGETWVYSIGNITQFIYSDYHYSDEDPAVNSDTIAVAEGDEVEIFVNTYSADFMLPAPAGEIAIDLEFTGAVEPVEGETITLMDWVWNDEGTAATATVTVPAGTINTYEAYRVAGMQLTINGGEPEILAAQSPMYPVAIVIANNMPFEQEYTLEISFPLGHMQNPEEIWWLGEQLVDLEEGDQDGYYYIYTADSDAVLEVSINGVFSEAEGVEADVVIFNANTYEQKSVQADAIAGTLMLEVAAGDVLNIQVVVQPDMENDWAIHAASVNWEINYPAGSEQNPLYPDFVWNEEQTSGEYATTIDAGETLYVALTQTGAELTVNGEDAGSITGSRYMPQILPIQNDTEDVMTLSLVVSYPVGSDSNPDELTEGETTVELKDGSEGYYYEYVAEADGILTVAISGESWQYNVNNIGGGHYGEMHWHDDETVVESETLEVKKGDVITIFVNTYDPEMSWYAPAGKITLNMTFEKTGMLGDVNGDGKVDVLDLMRLANFFAGKDVEIAEGNADVNGDGKVDVLDLMRLANYFAGKAQLG